MPEKNEQLVKDWQVEVKELESELEKANTLLKSKMDQVNKETNVSLLYIIIHYVFNEFLIQNDQKLQDKKKPVETKLNQLQSVVNEAKTKVSF